MKSAQILTSVLLALGAWGAQNSVEKAGYCPDIRPCEHMCSSDANCPPNLKCCRLGCNWRCVNTTQEKNGMCPMAIPLSSSEKQWNNRLCTKTCKNDLDCEGEAKCCSSSCGRTCSMPVKDPPTAKPGRCPAMSMICPKFQIQGCQRDEHCKGRKKCCSSACGRRCMKPFPEHEAVTRSFHREESTALAL